MRRHFRLAMVALIVGGLMPLIPVGSALGADAVVSGACTEVEFDAALATIQASGGGTMTFDCDDENQENIALTTAEVISTNVTIDGGAAQFGLSMGFNDRHFFVSPGVTLELHNITLGSGSVAGDGGSIVNLGGTVILNRSSVFQSLAGGDGGGILNVGGTVRLEDQASISSNGSNGQGAGIFNAGGTVEVMGGSSFIFNNAQNRGGAIFNFGGSVLIDGSTLDDNSSTRRGGAIYNDSGGQVTIRNGSHVEQNAADTHGGAIYNNSGGSLTIEDTQFRQDAVLGRGGAIYSLGTLDVFSSDFLNNLANLSGGAIFVAGGTADFSYTTFRHNDALDRGGALRTEGGLTTIDTSTISSNTAGLRGGGIQDSSSVVIANTTITLNGSLLGGAGVDSNVNGSVEFTNTIVADNLGDDCRLTTGTSHGNNLDTDSTCGFTDPTDISPGVANLGPLADNGGTTLTHLPGPLSDAIDNGALTCPSPDQRGQIRPRNGVCDIGSVETIPPPDVCWNTHTGKLRVFNGSCIPSHEKPLIFAEEAPVYLCANPFTGVITRAFTPTCPPYGRPAIVMPDAAPLSVCLNVYTGNFRLPRPGQACLAGSEMAYILG